MSAATYERRACADFGVMSGGPGDWAECFTVCDDCWERRRRGQRPESAPVPPLPALLRAAASALRHERPEDRERRRTAHLADQLDAAAVLADELAGMPVVFEHPRGDYVEVQIDRDLWEALTVGVRGRMCQFPEMPSPDVIAPQ